MQANPTESLYFETPEREERLLLVMHLLENAREIVYLRGPAGMGKTLFARRLMARLAEGFNFVWLDAAQEHDLAAVTARQLDVDAATADDWPDNLLLAMAERELLIVVDNADRLEATTMGQVVALRDRGTSVLLVGRGDLLADASSDPSPRVIDLPAFSEAQSAAFLRSRIGPAGSHVDGDLAMALHSASQGRPGPLLDGLTALQAQARQSDPLSDPPEARPRRVEHRGTDRDGVRGGISEGVPDTVRTAVAGRSALAGAALERARGAGAAWARLPLPRRLGLVGGVILAVVLLLAVLVFQDSINTWVAGSDDAADAPPRVAVDPAPGSDPASPGAAQGGTTSDSLLADQAAQPEARIAATAGDNGPPAPAEKVPAPSVPGAGPVASPEPAPPVVGAGPVGDVTGGVAEDPLEAVMRDALAAAAREDAAAVAPVVSVPTDAPATGQARAPLVDAEPPAAGPVARSGDAAPAVEDDAPSGPTATPAPIPPQDPAVAWLRSRAPDRYTLQVLGSRERAAIDRFVARHGLGPPYAVFERTLKDAPWYSLVVGDYADRASAVAARADLPSALRETDVWPRSFGSIQASLP